MVHGKTRRSEFTRKLMEGMLTYRNVKERPGNNLKKAGAVDRSSGFHWPEKLLGTTRLVCLVCKADSLTERSKMLEAGVDVEYQKPSRTQYKCHTCQVPLCLSCMPRYHENLNIQGLDIGLKRIRKKKTY